MTEWEKFSEYIKDKSEATKKSYKTQYKKLRNLVENEDIGNISQKKLLEIFREIENTNSIQSLINIAVLIRRMDGLAIDKLVEEREKNKNILNNEVKVKNDKLHEDLPSYETLVEYTNKLYDDNKYIEFMINYLLLNCYVRNEDLIVELVERKKDITDKDKNYIWVDLRMKKCLYVRNVYKTANTYGTKKTTIKDERFFKVMKYFLTCKKKDYKCKTIIPNDKQIGYYVKKATYQELGETKYMKICVYHYKNNLAKLADISDSRGTSLETIVKHYNIE